MGAFLSDSLSWFSLYLTHTHIHSRRRTHPLSARVCLSLALPHPNTKTVYPTLFSGWERKEDIRLAHSPLLQKFPSLTQRYSSPTSCTPSNFFRIMSCRPLGPLAMRPLRRPAAPQPKLPVQTLRMAGPCCSAWAASQAATSG